MYIHKLIKEAISNVVGWVTGLLSIDILDYFFIQKSWKNVWGLFSKRTAVNAETYSFLEWLLTTLLGLVVMILVNRLVRRHLLGLVFKKNKSQETETENDKAQNA